MGSSGQTETLEENDMSQTRDFFEHAKIDERIQHKTGSGTITMHPNGKQMVAIKRAK